MELSAIQQNEPVGETKQGQLNAVIETLQTGSRFLLISHLRPDGDAVGSLAGLARSLRKAGKKVDIALIDPPPARFKYLLDDEEIKQVIFFDANYDSIVILDTGDLARSGFEGELSDEKTLIVNIDHHASNTSFGDINLLDFHASSTSEMVVEILRVGKFPIDVEVAEPLYLGILTDTRFFQNEKIQPSTFLTAGFLLSSGLDTSPIHNRLNRTRILPELKILGRGLSKCRVSFGERLISVLLTRKDLAACKATLENVWASGLFGQLTSLEKTVVAACFMEGADGRSYCELRSNGNFDVKEIAVEMGGGGHLCASGCNSPEDIKEFSKKVLALVRKKLSDFLGKQEEKKRREIKNEEQREI